jgi:sugar phosphate permease
MIFTVFLLGYFTKYLIDSESLDVDKGKIGFIIAMWAFFYTLAAFVAGPLSKKYSQRVVSFASYILIGLACLLFGPSDLIGLTKIY